MGNVSSLLFSALFTYKMFDLNYSELHALSINNALSLFFLFVCFCYLLPATPVSANPHQSSSDVNAS